uniref:Uncharacterized protein n=1 Tax=Glossina pallidipes TaxID=7398 RepID=A0A1A9ZA69_GLOPL
MKQAVPLIIKPKTEQKVKVDFNKSVGPKKLKVPNVRYTKNGDVVIDYSGVYKRKKVKAAIESTMPKEYEVMVPTKLNCQFKFTVTRFSYISNEPLNKLRGQNPIPRSSGGDEFLGWMREMQSLRRYRGGGLLQVQRVSKSENDSVVEYLGVKISGSNSEFFVTCMYSPHNRNCLDEVSISYEKIEKSHEQ